MTASVLSIQLAALWILLIVAVFMSFALHKLHLSWAIAPSGVAMLLGMVCGQVFLWLGLQSSSFGFSPDVFFFGLLPPIVFSAGLGLRNRDFFRNFGTIIIFAIIGTFISAGVFSFGTFSLYKTGWIKTSSLGKYPLDDCLMYGSLVSATDTVATLSVLADLHAPHLVYSVVFGESVLNDAIAIVLFSAIDRSYGEGFTPHKVAEMMVKFLQIAFGSVLVGCGSALVSAALLFRLRFSQVQAGPVYNGSIYEISVMLLSAYLAYIVAEALDWSGIVALFFAGIIHNHYSMHNISYEGAQAAADMVEVASFCAETFVFIYLGLQVPHTFHGARRKHLDWGLVLTSLPMCLLARACSVFPVSMFANLFRTQPIMLGHQIMIWSAGLRGSVAYALSLRLRSPYDDDVTGNEALEIATLAIVVVSTIVLGATTAPIINMLRPKSEDAPVQRASSNLVDLATMQPDGHGLAPRGTLETFFGSRVLSDSQWTWELGPSMLPRLSMPASGIHAMWRKFDRIYLKPIFGGRQPQAINAASSAPAPRIPVLDSDSLHESTTDEPSVRQQPTTFAHCGLSTPFLESTPPED